MQLQQQTNSKPNKGIIIVVTFQGNISISICHTIDLNIKVLCEETKALGMLVKIHKVTHSQRYYFP